MVPDHRCLSLLCAYLASGLDSSPHPFLMASFRALLALLVLALVLHLFQSCHAVSGNAEQVTGSGPASPAKSKIDCGGACSVRCSRSWKPKMCLKMCGVCCSRCDCVPSGTGVETRGQCPCYAQMRSPKGKLKCP